MSRETRRRIGKVISPFVIAVLKVHTAVTGAERARVIVCNENGEILLVRGFIGSDWSLPGGGIEKGETARRAATRELFEETGIVLDETKLELAGVLKGKGSPVAYVAHIYSATIQRRDLPTVQYNTREIIDICWCDPSRLPSDISSIVVPSLRLLSKYRDLCYNN